MNTELPINGSINASSLGVLIVYDSVCSGKRAKYLCERIEFRLRPGNELNPSFWSLAALRVASFAQAAANDAAHAALLIVAINGDEVLSPPVKSSISRCARATRTISGALVAQLHGILRMNQELSPAYQCLKQIAHDAGVDFFSEVIEPSADELDCSIKTIHENARMNISMRDAILNQF